jgi:hypothetical protein
MEPRIVYHHPILDRKFNIAAERRLGSDDRRLHRAAHRQLHPLPRSWRNASATSSSTSSTCHGYLGHEFLSGFTRKGKFGGSFENRTRFAREIIEGIRAECPG